MYDFSVDFHCTDVDDILDIHEYVMKKHSKKYFLGLLENVYWIIKFWWVTVL